MLITSGETKWRYAQVETALCLWEAVLDTRTIGFAKEKADEDPGETYRKLEKLFDDNGSYTMRAAVSSITDECDRAWEAKKALLGDDTHESFDFDFCPEFIKHALDNGMLDQAAEWQYTPVKQIRDNKQWPFPIAA